MLAEVGGEYVEGLGAAIRAPGRWSVKVWPSCGEASVSFVRERRESIAPVIGTELAGRELSAAEWRVAVDAVESSEDRAVRRARSEVRRYNRHNGLTQMVTFTFAGDVPVFDSLGVVMKNFWRRFERATGRSRGPYCWVPEWGKVTGRLHVHMAVPWWDELRCVEVCPRCDRYGVLERFAGHRARVFERLGEAGLCVGCVWGLGFVGRADSGEGPVEDNSEGRALSRYLSKYLVKDLGGGGGRQRYRIGEGSRPVPVVVEAESPGQGVVLASEVLSCYEGGAAASPVMFVPAVEQGFGPPVLLLDWLAKGPRESEAQSAGD